MIQIQRTPLLHAPLYGQPSFFRHLHKAATVYSALIGIDRSDFLRYLPFFDLSLVEGM
jgi:hypothetical protein